jgi:hypothetical protein
MLSEKKNTARLPDELKRYFWDVEFEELTIEKYPKFIAERILNYGSMEEVRWLVSWADQDFIRNIVENSRNLNAKSRNFWKMMLPYLTEKTSEK